MNKTKKTIGSIILVGIISIGTFSVTRAQEELSIVGSELENSKSLIIADVNLLDLKVERQEGHKFTVSFDLSNNSNVDEDQIKYAVDLSKMSVNEDDKSVFGNSVVDSRVFEESLFLRSGETVHREIYYEAPPAFSGEFMLGASSMKKGGLLLAINPGEKIVLEETNKGVEIIKKSCLVYINDEGRGYGLNHGVDIDRQKENIRVYCDVRNNSTENQTFVTKSLIKERTSFGEVVGESLSLVELNLIGGETRKSYFDIPLPDKAQAYDTEISLYSNDLKISNTVTVHYVIQGESASIQNVQLDKDHYIEGETANLMFIFGGQADIFYGSRLLDSLEEYQPKTYKFEVKIENNTGELCAEDQGSFDESKNDMIKKDIIIKTECSDPRVNIRLMSSDGRILDEDNFGFKSKKEEKTNNVNGEISAENKSDSSTIKKILIGLMIILVVVMTGTLLVFAFIKRGTEGKGNNLMLVFLFSGAGFFLFVGEASAVTISLHSSWSRAGFTSPSTVVFTPDTITPSAGGTLTVSVASTVRSCANGGLYVKAYVDGVLTINGAECERATCDESGSRSINVGSVCVPRSVGVSGESWSTTLAVNCATWGGTYTTYCSWDTAASSIGYNVINCNAAPIVTINSIANVRTATGPYFENEVVDLRGTVTDPDGDAITAWRWGVGSCGDNSLATVEDPNSVTLPGAGNHTVYFRAQDSNGAWSACDTRTITIGENGKCDPATMLLYPCDAKDLVGNQCSSTALPTTETTTSTEPRFPFSSISTAVTEKASWVCPPNIIGNPATCKVKRLQIAPSFCGTATAENHKEKPTSNLCGVRNSLVGSPGVTLAGGAWRWRCQGDCNPNSANCFSRVPVDTNWKETN